MGYLSVIGPSAVPGSDRLQRRKAVERLEPLFAPVSRLADPPERQFDSAARAIVVEKDLARAQGPREPHLAASVRRPDAGYKTIAGPVGDRRRVRFVVEGDGDLDRPENLVLRQTMAGRHIGEQGRGR